MFNIGIYELNRMSSFYNLYLAVSFYNFFFVKKKNERFFNLCRHVQVCILQQVKLSKVKDLDFVRT